MAQNHSNVCSNRVVLDYRAHKETVEELEKLGFVVVPSLKLSNLYNAIDGHCDIQLFKCGDGLIVAPEAYDYYKNKLADINIIKGSKSLKTEYPHDIAYNSVNLGNYIICNRLYTAIEILEYGVRYSKKILNVRQGYAKCSVCIVNGNAIITADKSIIKICKENKIDVLEINQGYIELNGVDYGFIGGATGLINKTTLAVNGELKTHPDCNNIISFCKNYNVDVVELKKGNLYDIGSIFTI